MTCLEEYFEKNPDVALAFSGGTDSAYLLYAAMKYAKRVRAYYVKTAFQPAFELNDALRLGRELGADLRVLCLDVLKDERISANPPERCYYCKRRLFEAIAEKARGDGSVRLIDGTNASDEVCDRPGMRALEELGFESPLRLCGFSKADVRELSREAGLFTWDKPAYACLATRIPAGRPIERRLLRRTEAAEEHMAGLGFSGFRIRNSGETAKLELTEKDLPLFEQKRNELYSMLREYYEDIAGPELRYEH